MTRDDILRMGVETDLFIYNGDDTSLTIWLIPTEEKFLKFAALVAAAEREACAEFAEEEANNPALTLMEQYRAKFIADAIRARGKL